MRHPRIILAGVGLAAVAAVGGVTAAFSGRPSAGSGPSASSGLSASPTAAAATVRTQISTSPARAETAPAVPSGGGYGY